MIIYHKYDHFSEIDEEFKDGLGQLLSDYYLNFDHFENSISSDDKKEIYLFFHSSGNRPVGITICDIQDSSELSLNLLSLLNSGQKTKDYHWTKLNNLLPSYYFHPAHEKECLLVFKEIVLSRIEKKQSLKLRKSHLGSFLQDIQTKYINQEEKSPSYFIKQHTSFKEFTSSLDPDSTINTSLKNFINNLEGKVLIQDSFPAMFSHLPNGQLQADALSQLSDIAKLISTNPLHYIGIFKKDQLIALFNIYQNSQQTLDYSFCELNNTLGLGEEFYFGIFLKYFFQLDNYNKIAYKKEIFPQTYQTSLKKFIQFEDFCHITFNPGKELQKSINQRESTP